MSGRELILRMKQCIETDLKPVMGSSIEAFFHDIEFAIGCNDFRIVHKNMEQNQIIIRIEAGEKITELKEMLRFLNGLWSKVKYDFLQASALDYHQDGISMTFLSVGRISQKHIFGRIQVVSARYASLLEEMQKERPNITILGLLDEDG
jgi:hypothetical protein